MAPALLRRQASLVQGVLRAGCQGLGVPVEPLGRRCAGHPVGAGMSESRSIQHPMAGTAGCKVAVRPEQPEACMLRPYMVTATLGYSWTRPQLSAGMGCPVTDHHATSGLCSPPCMPCTWADAEARPQG